MLILNIISTIFGANLDSISYKKELSIAEHLEYDLTCFCKSLKICFENMIMEITNKQKTLFLLKEFKSDLQAIEIQPCLPKDKNEMERGKDLDIETSSYEDYSRRIEFIVNKFLKKERKTFLINSFDILNTCKVFDALNTNDKYKTIEKSKNLIEIYFDEFKMTYFAVIKEIINFSIDNKITDDINREELSNKLKIIVQNSKKDIEKLINTILNPVHEQNKIKKPMIDNKLSTHNVLSVKEIERGNEFVLKDYYRQTLPKIYNKNTSETILQIVYDIHKCINILLQEFSNDKTKIFNEIEKHNPIHSIALEIYILTTEFDFILEYFMHEFVNSEQSSINKSYKSISNFTKNLYLMLVSWQSETIFETLRHQKIKILSGYSELEMLIYNEIDEIYNLQMPKSFYRHLNFNNKNDETKSLLLSYIDQNEKLITLLYEYFSLNIKKIKSHFTLNLLILKDYEICFSKTMDRMFREFYCLYDVFRNKYEYKIEIVIKDIANKGIIRVEELIKIFFNLSILIEKEKIELELEHLKFLIQKLTDGLLFFSKKFTEEFINIYPEYLNSFEEYTRNFYYKKHVSYIYQSKTNSIKEICKENFDVLEQVKEKDHFFLNTSYKNQEDESCNGFLNSNLLCPFNLIKKTIEFKNKVKNNNEQNFSIDECSIKQKNFLEKDIDKDDNNIYFLKRNDPIDLTFLEESEKIRKFYVEQIQNENKNIYKIDQKIQYIEKKKEDKNEGIKSPDYMTRNPRIILRESTFTKKKSNMSIIKKKLIDELKTGFKQ